MKRAMFRVMSNREKQKNGQDIQRNAEWFRGHGFDVKSASTTDGIVIVVEQRWLLIGECERLADLLREHGVEPQRTGENESGVNICGMYNPMDDESSAAKIIVKGFDALCRVDA